MRSFRRILFSSWAYALILVLLMLTIWRVIEQGHETHRLACRTYDTTLQLIVQRTNFNDAIFTALGFNAKQIAQLRREAAKARAEQVTILGPRDPTCPPVWDRVIQPYPGP